MTGQLFLSHAHADKPEAQALRRALEDSGVGVWEDVLDLRAGGPPQAQGHTRRWNAQSSEIPRSPTAV
jgi:hypothetical protein